MIIRYARSEDGPAAIDTLRASITELCVLDHKSDAHVLATWLSNKTIESFRSWRADPSRLIWVCVSQDGCLGVAMASTDGEIMLNYVAPGARFRGVSTALLETVEAHLFGMGFADLRLWSTQTAHRFYQSRGWQDHGFPIEEASMISYPMKKTCSV